MTKPIKFSVVLPVHNGILHIKECIDSVLSQSYSNFDLIVLENGSNDGTVDFLNSVSDERLKIFPADSFISMEDNYLRINEIPKNEFFTLIGHDDIYDANYLEVMRDLIIDNPNATIFQAHFRFVNFLIPKKFRPSFSQSPASSSLCDAPRNHIVSPCPSCPES
mgnify:CR=1 FL=1